MVKLYFNISLQSISYCFCIAAASWTNFKASC